MKCSLKSFFLIIAFLVAFAAVDANAQGGRSLRPPGGEVLPPPYVPDPEGPLITPLIPRRPVIFVNFVSGSYFTAEVEGYLGTIYNIPILHFDLNLPLDIKTVTLSCGSPVRRIYRYNVNATTTSIDVPAPTFVGAFSIVVLTSDGKEYSLQGWLYSDGTIAF